MYKTVRTENKDWNNYLELLPVSKRDVYYTREYSMACEKNGDGVAELFIYQGKEGIVLYPYLINRIGGYALKKEYYDIQTCYGYGGPIASSDNKQVYINFRKEFSAYCQEKKIICEFIRFHPGLSNANREWTDIEVEKNRTTVMVDLLPEIEDIWLKQITSKNRNMIRKALKNGLSVEEGSDINEFISIYRSTMDKVQAQDYYFFSDAYFKQMLKIPHIQLNIKRENITIASAIFMICGNYLHYHLSGSKEEELKYAPNNLLLWEAINYGKKLGAEKLHLGGGISNSLEDCLFKFKNSFSNQTRDFCIGKCIQNEQIYKELIEEWEFRNKKRATLFLQYRY